MESENTNAPTQPPQATTDELNRVLELGRLLYVVLTPEEINALNNLLNSQIATSKIGNAGDS